MEVKNKPELTHLTLGDTFKVLLVKGLTGMKMPPHHSTQEAVIVVQKGEALLQLPDGEHLLKVRGLLYCSRKKGT